VDIALSDLKRSTREVKSEKRREVSKIAERETRIDLEVEECTRTLKLPRCLRRLDLT
jgi:hypothetical protein